MYVKMMSDEKHAIFHGKIKPILFERFPCYCKKTNDAIKRSKPVTGTLWFHLSFEHFVMSFCGQKEYKPYKTAVDFLIIAN